MVNKSSLFYWLGEFDLFSDEIFSNLFTLRTWKSDWIRQTTSSYETFQELSFLKEWMLKIVHTSSHVFCWRITCDVSYHDKVWKFLTNYHETCFIKISLFIISSWIYFRINILHCDSRDNKLFQTWRNFVKLFHTTLSPILQIVISNPDSRVIKHVELREQLSLNNQHTVTNERRFGALLINIEFSIRWAVV